MNAAQQISIYTVYVFQIREGKRVLSLHYAAGFSSEDAERRIKSIHDAQAHLAGECYISTDDLRERDPAADCKLYVTNYTNEASISDESHRSWVRHMTRETWSDGDRYPATLRRFHVQPALAKAA